MAFFGRALDVWRALRINRAGRARSRWDRPRLDAWRRARLDALLQHARARSPYYADALRGVGDVARARLEELPVLTKATMMRELDRVFTEPALRHADLLAYTEHAGPDTRHLGRYRVLTTGGSSGVKGVFVYDRREWSVALASVLRWSELMGVRPQLLPRRLRVCSIGGDNPMHGTYLAAASLDVGLHRVLRLDATAPIRDLVRDLNDFQPDVINAYPSIAALLAAEQVEGRLRIEPHAVSTSSELRTPAMQRAIETAWGTSPFNYYGMTEVMSFGSECEQHRGVHAYEDLFYFEVVDDLYRPVPDGEVGTKLLLTNLYNFTQPLIRYELSDMVAVAAEPCPCGRTFRLISTIEGRSDDVLVLAGAAGEPVPVHPIHFFTAIETIPAVKEFQVVHEADGLHIHVVLRGGDDPSAVVARLADDVRRRLGALGVTSTPVYIDIRAELAREAARMGKLKVVVSSVTGRPAA